MTVYYINLALILGLGIWLCEYKPTPLKKGIYLTAVFGYMFALQTLRFGIGFDYRSYWWHYTNTGFAADEIAGVQPSIFSTRSGELETGYQWLTNLIYKISGGSYRALLGVIAFIVLFSAAMLIWRFAKHPWIAVYLYVTLTFFYGSMNYLRQYLALALIMWAFWFLFRKYKGVGDLLLWFLPYAALVGLAATFHISALIMLPVYFLVRIPPKPLTFVLYGVGTLAVHLLMDPILSWVYANTKYGYYEGTEYMKPLAWYFLLIPLLMCLLAVLFSKKLVERDSRNGILVNLVIFSFVFWSVAVRAMLLERFSMYFYFAVLLLIPEIYDVMLPHEDIARRSQLVGAAAAKRGPGAKTRSAAVRQLDEKIDTRTAFTVSGLCAVLLCCLIYHGFGVGSGYTGFHGTFPYKTTVQWIEKLDGQDGKYLIWWNNWFGETYYEAMKDWKNFEDYPVYEASSAVSEAAESTDGTAQP